MVLHEKKLKFALFGHGFHLCYLAKALIKNGFEKPVIITHPKLLHERDRSQLTDPKLYEYLFDVANDYHLTVLEAEKVDQPSVLNFLAENKCDVGFSLSCRSIIGKKVIDFFDGKIFNIHPAYLPKERGGGIFSWRILNNIKEISATIHYLDEGIDTGNIVLQEKGILEKKYPKPYDYLVATNDMYQKLINEFIKELSSILSSSGTIQLNADSTYFPRLYTELNGAIDWSWDGDIVERTIRAFSDPYPGSFTYLKDQKMHIPEAMFEKHEHQMHPLLYGKIIRLNENGHAHVVVRDGFVIVPKIKDLEGRVMVPGQIINLPSQFYTPHQALEEAKHKTMKVSKM